MSLMIAVNVGRDCPGNNNCMVMIFFFGNIYIAFGDHKKLSRAMQLQWQRNY